LDGFIRKVLQCQLLEFWLEDFVFPKQNPELPFRERYEGLLDTGQWSNATEALAGSIQENEILYGGELVIDF